MFTAHLIALGALLSKIGGPFGSWFSDKLLAPALVAVVFSGLTNVVLERLKAKRDQATKLCDGLRTDVGILQQLAGDYWSRTRKPADPLIEAKILALQSEIIGTAAMLKEDFRLDLGDDNFFADIADALTGGDFGAAVRAIDRDRLGASQSLLSDLRMRITRERWRRMKSTGW